MIKTSPEPGNKLRIGSKVIVQEGCFLHRIIKRSPEPRDTLRMGSLVIVQKWTKYDFFTFYFLSFLLFETFWKGHI